MVPWYGRETADIIYDDTEGAFTSLLIDHGYLEADEWEDRRPRYFIEIKTTTGPLCAPFYMSKRQFERVSKLCINKRRNKVYCGVDESDARQRRLFRSILDFPRFQHTWTQYWDGCILRPGTAQAGWGTLVYW